MNVVRAGYVMGRYPWAVFPFLFSLYGAGFCIWNDPGDYHPISFRISTYHLASSVSR